MKKRGKQPKRHTTITISEELWQNLETFARENYLSKTAVLSLAIKKYLANGGQ